jgi:hypothetical protein
MRDVDDNVARQLNASFAILMKARNEKLRNGESLVEIDNDILEYAKRTYSLLTQRGI